LASIAIPIDKINQAIDAKVKTTQNILTIVNISITYIKSVIDAIKPDNLYVNIKNKKINMNQATHAIINFSRDDAHNLESIVFSDVKYIGAGTTQVLIF